jgi:hypothetical protein
MVHPTKNNKLESEKSIQGRHGLSSLFRFSPPGGETHSRLWLILWVIGILFPMVLLGKFWPAFGNVFNAVFSPVWTHILMHTLLYAVLGFLLAQWITPTSRKAILVLVGLSLLVGCLHEGLQLLAADVWPGWPAEILDLSVDLIGANIGIGASCLSVRGNKGRRESL